MRLNRLKCHKKRNIPLVIKISFITVCISVSGMVVWRIAAEERFYQRSIMTYETHNISQYNEFRNYLTSITNQRFQRYLEKQAQSFLDGYREQTMSFEAVRDQLQRLQSFAYEPQAFETYFTQLKDIQVSQQAFERGEAYAKTNDWKQARLAYLQVTPIDPNYENAQRALQQIGRWEVASYLTEALTAFEEERMDEALAIVEKGLTIYPNQSELLQLQSDLQTAIEGRQPLPEHWNRWKEALESHVDEVFKGIHNKIANFGDWLKKILP